MADYSDCYIPNDLDDAIRELNDNVLNSDSREKLLNIIDNKNVLVEKSSPYTSAEEDLLLRTHHSLGKYLRNRWDLWGAQNRFPKIVEWFNEKGIHHADDMTCIIITSWYRKQKGMPFILDEQIEYYKKYWQKEKGL